MLFEVLTEDQCYVRSLIEERYSILEGSPCWLTTHMGEDGLDHRHMGLFFLIIQNSRINCDNCWVTDMQPDCPYTLYLLLIHILKISILSLYMLVIEYIYNIVLNSEQLSLAIYIMFITLLHEGNIKSLGKATNK